MPKSPSSEITSQRVYLNRRAFMQSLMVAGGAALAGDVVAAQQPAVHGRKLTTVPSPFSTKEKPKRSKARLVWSMMIESVLKMRIVRSRYPPYASKMPARKPFEQFCEGLAGLWSRSSLIVSTCARWLASVNTQI